MAENLSYIEQMEAMYVLNETKTLLKQKLEASNESEEQNIIKEDLNKIEQEIKSITKQSPGFENNTLNFVFPYYEVDDYNEPN